LFDTEVPALLNLSKRFFTALALWLICSFNVTPQSAQPTNNIMFKTLMIKTKTETGTMFSIEVDGREYWLTAKHILTGRQSGPAGEIGEKTASLDVLDPIGDSIKWNPTRFTVIDPGKDIDIVVLVPGAKLQDIGLPSLKVSSGDFGMGQECSFLGFPFAGTWTATFSNSTRYKMPFIKHCYISGIIRQPTAILILDGINNPGFSGGPVLYHTGADQVVIGVIAGYRHEPTEVYSLEMPSTPTAMQTTKKNVVNQNTGIIFAFAADAAVEAIRKNAIGPQATQVPSVK
jgi:hypothetical protein